MSSRLADTFARLGGTPAFVAYIMGGDPDAGASLELLHALPGAGVDIVELGFPFTDPAADGPTIAEAGQRALKAGTTLEGVLEMLCGFRARNADTPVILMGYANPLFRRGWEVAARDLAEAGADGVIVVDLPPEEDTAFREALGSHGLHLIRLATPTTTPARMARVADGAGGFVYYVSSTGVTGAADADARGMEAGLARARKAARDGAGVPTVVGFGIKTPAQAREVAALADGVVVGSAIVRAHHEEGKTAALELVRSLADAVHGEREN